MKTMISCLILTFFITGISAQEISTTNQNSHKQNTLSKIINKDATTSTATVVAVGLNTIEKDICYSESSKKAFYEALIRQNDLKINLDANNDKVAIKTTEDLINSKKNRISYTK